MLSLNQCLEANRPLIFTVCESDIEVLKYLGSDFKDNNFFVYSQSFTGIIPLDTVLSSKFVASVKSKPLDVVLTEILAKDIGEDDSFHSYIFLDCANYIRDPIVIRKIKDILARYQLDPPFVINLIFLSHSICVPPELERLSEVVFFDLPSEDDLKSISSTVTKRLELKGDAKPTEEVVNNLKGLTLFEVEQAYLQSYQIYKKIDLSFIRDFKKSAIAKTNLLSLLESDVTFDDIGGLDRLKNWIIKSYGGWTVEGKHFGLPLLKGLLLVGLPGCGKSLCSKALGNLWNLPVIQFDPSRVFSSNVGESEGNMRRVLQIVENIAPCILFIDEIEKGFAGMHSSTFSDSGVTARVIGSFLIWLQECKKPVFTVATSNAIHYLPPEMISRFDETFFVNMPSLDERKAIFSIHLKKLDKNRPVENPSRIDVNKFDILSLANMSEDLSGREIEQVLKEAMYDSFSQKTELSTSIIQSVLRKKTSILTTMAEQLKLLLDWVGWDKERCDGVRARFANSIDDENVIRIKDEIDRLVGDVERGSKPPNQDG